MAEKKEWWVAAGVIAFFAWPFFGVAGFIAAGFLLVCAVFAAFLKLFGQMKENHPLAIVSWSFVGAALVFFLLASFWMPR